MTNISVNELIEKGLYHEVHISEIREFQKCEQSWYWKYVEQWYPNTKAMPLEFGTAFHAGMQAYFDTQAWALEKGNRLDSAIEAFLKVNDEQRAKALTQPFAEEQTINQDFEDREDLGVGMLRNYADKVVDKEDASHFPLLTEVKFAVPVSEYWCNCDKCLFKISNSDEKDLKKLPVCFEGRIDIVFKHLINQHIIIGDWKTTARLKDSYEFLNLDIQIAGYWWAMVNLGYNVREAFYHDFLKSYPSPPELLARPYRGKKYSTNRSQNTTYDLVLSTIAVNDQQAYLEGLYDTYLDWISLETQPTYHREYIHLTNAALEDFEHLLKRTVEQMNSVTFSGKPVKSPTQYGCSRCEFLQVCIEKTNGMDYEYLLNDQFKQQKPYYEIEEQ